LAETRATNPESMLGFVEEVVFFEEGDQSISNNLFEYFDYVRRQGYWSVVCCNTFSSSSRVISEFLNSSLAYS
jgi:MoaA/NifB/PqqE/SkfB family radical SAM enzyme